MRKLLTVLLAVLLCCGLVGCSPKDEKKVYRIGICQLIQHEALDLATKGFKDAVIAGLGEENVEFDEQNAAGESSTAATICNGFAANNVDLIMANATAALQAAVSATATIPVLGTSITEYGTALGIYNFNGVVGGNVSGCSDLAPLDQQAAEIVALFPEAKKVSILYSSSEPNSKYQVLVISSELAKLNIEVNEVSFVDSSDVALATEQACADADVVYIPTDNTCASCTETIAPIAEKAGVPIYAGEKGICKGCGVATLTIDYYDLGYATGKMAVEVLTGGDISTMPIKYSEEFTKKYNPKYAEMYNVSIPGDYVPVD